MTGRRPRRRGGTLARVLAAGVVGALGLAGYGAMRITLEGSRNDLPARADAIVVLGASQEHGRPNPVLRARLDHAVALYRDGLAPFFVVTGGTAEGDALSEAEAARRYALANGVPAGAILAETRGRDTLTSLSGVRAVLRTRGLSAAVFVSDSTHLLRVLTIARDMGMTAHGSPAPDSPTDRDAAARALAIARELLALGEYLLIRRSQGSATP